MSRDGCYRMQIAGCYFVKEVAKPERQKDSDARAKETGGDMYDHARVGETKMEMEMADGRAHGVRLYGNTCAGFFMISVGPAWWGTM